MVSNIFIAWESRVQSRTHNFRQKKEDMIKTRHKCSKQGETYK